MHPARLLLAAAVVAVVAASIARAAPPEADPPSPPFPLASLATLPPFHPDPAADDRASAGLAAASRDALIQFPGTHPLDELMAEILPFRLASFAADVRQAPDDPHLRYRLACGLMAGGHLDEAATQLEPLARAGCPECRNALAQLFDGDDFFCGWDVAAPRLAKVGRQLRRTPVYTAALEVRAAFAAGTPHRLELLLPREGTIEVTENGMLSDPPDDVVRTSVPAPAFRSWLAESWPRARSDEARVRAGGNPALECRGRCCTTVQSSASHDMSYFQGVCFTDEAAPRLASLTIGRD